MRTKMMTSAVLSGTGDLIAQMLEPAAGGFAVRRLFTLVAVNVLYIVPTLTLFYEANERVAEKLKLKDGWKRTGVQLAFDQVPPHYESPGIAIASSTQHCSPRGAFPVARSFSMHPS